jgi:uncharacterized membrane protein YhaH (DUF805 family)
MGDPADVNPYASPQTLLEPAEARTGQRTLLRLLFSFQGRIPRRTYWGLTLSVVVVAFAAMFVITLAFGEDSQATTLGSLVIEVFMLWLYFATEARRWHDRNKSAAWILIRLVPIVGQVWVGIEVGCLRGTQGPNRYGPDPT